MVLENWMIVVSVLVFLYAIHSTWKKAYSIGCEDGAESLAMSLNEMGIIDAEFTENGILRISKIGEFEIKDDD